jgi:hypothetical protein
LEKSGNVLISKKSTIKVEPVRPSFWCTLMLIWFLIVPSNAKYSLTNSTCTDATLLGDGLWELHGYGSTSEVLVIANISSPDERFIDGDCDLTVPQECRTEMYGLFKEKLGRLPNGKFVEGYEHSELPEGALQGLSTACKAQIGKGNGGPRRKLAFTAQGSLRIDGCAPDTYNFDFSTRCSEAAAAELHEYTVNTIYQEERLVSGTWQVSCPRSREHIRQQIVGDSGNGAMYYKSECTSCGKFSRKSGFPVAWQKRTNRYAVDVRVPPGDTRSGVIKHQDSLTRIRENMLDGCFD